MDLNILTPRLRLTLVTTAERGSQELGWVHKVRSDKQAMFWSITAVDKSTEDTAKFVNGYLPTKSGYRVLYVIHKILEPANGSAGGEAQAAQQPDQSTEIIGIVNLRSLEAGALPIPERFTIPAASAATIVTVEVAYMLLPAAWGKGYATESVNAVFEACKAAKSFWEPFSKVYIRAIVNSENPGSARVMSKTGMKNNGTYEWAGEAVFVAGRWREEDCLHIYGMHLME